MSDVMPSAAASIPSAVATPTMMPWSIGQSRMTWPISPVRSAKKPITSDMAGANIVSNVAETLFVTRDISSPMVVAPSAVCSMTPWLSCKASEKRAMSKLPLCTHCAISCAAFLPKTCSTVLPVSPTCAFSASDTESQSSIAAIASLNAPGTSSVTLDRFVTVFVRPAITTDVFAPPSDRLVMKAIESSSEKPSSWN